jgi:hypothetical protein
MKQVGEPDQSNSSFSNTYVLKTRKMKIVKYKTSTSIIRKFSLCLFIIGFCHGINAQNSAELSLHVKGQFSKLKYEYSGGNNDMDNGYAVGINYAYYLRENWSLSTGAEYQRFLSNAYLKDLKGSTLSNDPEGENFEFRYAASQYVEDQKAGFINIPIKVQYETSGSVTFYAAGGVKIGLNLDSSYEFRVLDLMTSGYYEQYNAELKNPAFIGFGEFGTYEGESDFELAINYILNLETGVKLETGNSTSLYIGMFMDYGLNDIKEENIQTELFKYNPDNPTSFQNCGVVYGSMNGNPITEKIKTIAFGLKLRYGIKL